MLWGTMTDCPVEKECLDWVHRYLKDCVCSFRDEVSLALGLISVVSWGIAEVPQIITNFRERSTEGVSLAFLMTWVVGDVFNLAGCYLEPATLPTQFYMALLYTFTTCILVAQTIYYDYFDKSCNVKMGYVEIESPEECLQKHKVDVETRKPVHVETSKLAAPCKSEQDGSSPGSTPISVINVPLTRRTSLKASDLYYTSARSLASSHNPGIGSYINVGSRDRESGSSGTHGFLRSHVSSSPHGSVPRCDSGQSASLLRTAAGSVLLVGSVGMTSTIMSAGGFGIMSAGGFSKSNYPATQLFLTGRRLLQQIAVSRPKQHSYAFLRRSFFGEMNVESRWGEIFGWCMAAIYMGGRLPQILLNIKRGTVEGLNPLMFVFALVGNATYVGSILVRSVEWVALKPNLPWLVDAGVCVLLDLFILSQFMYYNLKVVDEGSSDSDCKSPKETLK